MNRELSESIVTKYSAILPSEVCWLWKPYIPYGKITVIQGDPGEGKSTLMLNIVAALSSGRSMPFSNQRSFPAQNVIYQCSEDGINDTIIPRLIKADANCERIAFIDEDKYPLVLGSQMIEKAISSFNAKLVVIDPIQSYLGDADLSYTGGMRKILHNLSLCGATHKCAIVLVGHLNKKENSKTLYRGLGTIDITAAARSVLLVDHADENPEVKRIHQVKNSLAQKGSDRYFSIDANGIVSWQQNTSEIEETIVSSQNNKDSKQEMAIIMLKNILKSKPVEVSEILRVTSESGISKRTVYLTRKLLPIQTIRNGKTCYWNLLPTYKGDIYICPKKE